MEDDLSLSDDELEYRFLIAHSNIQRLLETLNHDETVPSSPPAAKHIIENLPDVTTENNDECIICLKKFSEGEIAKKLPCSHLFDKECIVRWLQKTNTCPICRQEMPTDNEEYEKIRREKLRAKQREADLEILHHSMYS